MRTSGGLSVHSYFTLKTLNFSRGSKIAAQKTDKADRCLQLPDRYFFALAFDLCMVLNANMHFPSCNHRYRAISRLYCRYKYFTD